METTDLQRRSRRVRMFWIVAAVMVIAVVAVALRPRPVEADVVRADRGDVRVEVVDEGRTRMHDVYVISAPVSGRVLRVDVEPGDEVSAGATIARMSRAAAGFLDTRAALQAAATVDAADAQLRAAATDLALATREHARNTELATTGLVPRATAEQSEARLDAARAARDAAQADLRRARSALLEPDRAGGATVAVRTPSAGRVLRVRQESEAVVVAGAPIVDVGDPRHVEIVGDFLSQDAVRLRPGAPARIENWGGPPLPAVVERIEPVARTRVSALGVEEQRTYVILQFAPEAQDYPRAHDFRVDVRIVADEALDVVRVPLGALFRRGDGWAVYKLVEGRAIATPVEVAQADGRHRAVLAGVAEGDPVIVFPGAAIADGVRVEPRTSDAEGAG